MKIHLLALAVVTLVGLAGCTKFTAGDAHRTMAHSQVTHGMTGAQHWNQLNKITTTNLRSLRDDFFRVWLYERPSRSSTYPIQ